MAVSPKTCEQPIKKPILVTEELKMKVTEEIYESFLTKLDENYSKLRIDLDKAIKNKSASLRARKNSLAFRQDLKDLRRMLLDYELE